MIQRVFSQISHSLRMQPKKFLNGSDVLKARTLEMKAHRLTKSRMSDSVVINNQSKVRKGHKYAFQQNFSIDPATKKQLETLPMEEFIPEAYSHLCKKMDISPNQRPVIIMVPERIQTAGPFSAPACYSMCTNEILICNKTMSKRKLYGYLAHELTHFCQHRASLCTPSVSKNSIDHFSRLYANARTKELLAAIRSIPDEEIQTLSNKKLQTKFKQLRAMLRRGGDAEEYASKKLEKDILGCRIGSWKKIQAAMQQTHKPLETPQQRLLSKAMEQSMQTGVPGEIQTQCNALHEVDALIASFKAMNAYSFNPIDWIGELAATFNLKKQLERLSKQC